MPSVPAFCDTCNAVFDSGMVIENSMNATLIGGTFGPCPNCGGTGHPPNGVFNFIGNTIEILSASERTLEELSRLAQIINEAKAKQQSHEQIAAQIKQDLPGLSSLADLLPKNRAELYGFLALIGTAIQLIIQLPQPSQNITVNVSQVVNQTFANSSPAKIKPNTLSKSKKIGRNEACPCGSLKRYKNSCGTLK